MPFSCITLVQLCQQLRFPNTVFDFCFTNSPDVPWFVRSSLISNRAPAHVCTCNFVWKSVRQRSPSSIQRLVVSHQRLRTLPSTHLAPCWVTSAFADLGASRARLHTLEPVVANVVLFVESVNLTRNYKEDRRRFLFVSRSWGLRGATTTDKWK